MFLDVHSVSMTQQQTPKSFDLLPAFYYNQQYKVFITQNANLPPKCVLQSKWKKHKIFVFQPTIYFQTKAVAK
jgi:hypothetical protein